MRPVRELIGEGTISCCSLSCPRHSSRHCVAKIALDLPQQRSASPGKSSSMMASVCESFPPKRNGEISYKSANPMFIAAITASRCSTLTFGHGKSIRVGLP